MPSHAESKTSTAASSSSSSSTTIPLAISLTLAVTLNVLLRLFVYPTFEPAWGIWAVLPGTMASGVVWVGVYRALSGQAGIINPWLNVAVGFCLGVGVDRVFERLCRVCCQASARLTALG
jgi:hypothetical protein